MEKNDWALDALRDVLLENMKERRMERRRKMIFRIIRLALFLLIVYLIYSSVNKSSEDLLDPAQLSTKHVATIKIDGIISDDATYGNAENVNKALKHAFKAKGSVGVLLDLNSPGGSAVQSNMIFEQIMKLRKQYPQKPVYAVVSEMCASGCYYIASAADKIYADPVSIVGSIGVIYNGFGFVDTIAKLGVERRVLTAGDHKDIMDPFKPTTKWDQDTMQYMLDSVHKRFIDSVKLGRGSRLKFEQDKDMFSGKFWLAEQGKTLGLVDELGTTDDALQALGTTRVINYTIEPDLLRRVSKKLGADTLFSGYSNHLLQLRALY